MDSYPLKKVAVIGTRRRKRYVPYKWRHMIQEQKDLEKWKANYEMMKYTRNKSLEETIRKLRMSQLLQYIKENLRKNRKRKRRAKLHKVSTDSIKMRWQAARQKGNEYSKFNKHNIFTIPNLPPLNPKKSKDRMLSAISARVYGNMVSNMNITRLQYYTRRRPKSPELEPLNETELLKEKRRNLLDYGSYYTLRNKLSLKDACGQFDHEYQDLLLKCVAFEKDHIEITGFLEEKFRSNMEFRRGMMALAYQESNKHEVKEREPPKKAALVASHKHTEQIIDMERIPSNEVFVSVTRIARPMQTVHFDVKPQTIVSAVPSDVKAETIVNAVRYSSHDHLANSPSEQPISENENVNWISDVITKNAYFEDTILDVMKSYRSVDSDSLEMQKLLSDLYLAFCMNLMKIAVNEKFIKEDVDIVAVRDAAVKQADAMSEALSEIFRNRSGPN